MNALHIRYRQHVLDCLTCRRARAAELLCAVGLELYTATLTLEGAHAA
jgi:hypothetical protein